MENIIKTYIISYIKYNRLRAEYYNYIEIVNTYDIYREIGKRVIFSDAQLEHTAYKQTEENIADIINKFIDLGYKNISKFVLVKKYEAEI